MKRKGFKMTLWILAAIVLLSVGIKAFLELEAHYFKKQLTEQQKKGLLTVPTKSEIHHKKLSLDASDIHYYMTGNQQVETLILLHPAFADHRVFDAQIDFFAQHYRVITIDLIGHGLSKVKQSKDKVDASAAHIQQILAREQIEQAHLLGVSMGALIAQYFAFQYPEKVQSLTLLGGYNIHDKNEEIEKAQQSVNLSLVFRALFSMDAFRKKTAEITCHTERGQALFYQATNHYKRSSLSVMQGLLKVIDNRTVNPPAYPSLILVGEHDLELGKKMAKQWHQTQANSQFEIMKGAGHCANVDDPEQFNQTVIQFLKNNKF